MKEFKQNLVDLIVAASRDLKIISLREVANANGINHIARQDVQDIVNAVRKALPNYRPVQMMNTPHDSLFVSVCFVQNDVTFDDEAEEIASDMCDDLSEFDKNRRESFFVCEAPFDEDGCCDLNRARIVKEFK